MFNNKSIIGIFTMLILITASVIFIGAGHEKTTEQTAGKMTAKQMITFMDSYGDGKITRDEAPAGLKAGFDFFDQNKDGEIDINEAQKPSAGPESLFGLDNIIDVHIRIEPE